MRFDELPSPSLLVYPQIIDRNIESMIRIAGDPVKLRPHCKTHKMREVIEMLLRRGVTKHKCATLAEAEMLASCGVTDIMLAYNVVGPNIDRVVRLLRRWPEVDFSCTGDHAPTVDSLGASVAKIGKTVDVLLDLNVGMHRTGIMPGKEAHSLYRAFNEMPGISLGGLHVYDGHNHQPDLAERTGAAREVWQTTVQFRDELQAAQLPVRRIVLGGTPTFPCYAKIDDRSIELSPGTVILHDAGYGKNYPDLPFEPAAKILTRVISRTGANRLTLDVGHKAIAGDPPAGRRVVFPELHAAQAVMHSEEHLVLETPDANCFAPGDYLLAIPIHICPTCALHREAYAIVDNEVVGTWLVAARDRTENGK